MLIIVRCLCSWVYSMQLILGDDKLNERSSCDLIVCTWAIGIAQFEVVCLLFQNRQLPTFLSDSNLSSMGVDMSNWPFSRKRHSSDFFLTVSVKVSVDAILPILNSGRICQFPGRPGADAKTRPTCFLVSYTAYKQQFSGEKTVWAEDSPTVTRGISQTCATGNSNWIAAWLRPFPATYQIYVLDSAEFLQRL